MIKSTLLKLAKKSNKMRPTTYERRRLIAESVMNDYKSGEYNPRTAKYRSLKGLFGQS